MPQLQTAIRTGKNSWMKGPFGNFPTLTGIAAHDGTVMTDSMTAQGTIPEHAKRVGYWKFWGTLVWSIAIMATLVIVGGIGVFVGLVWLDPGVEVPEDDLLPLVYSNGRILLFLTAAAFLSAFAVMALAVRLSGLGMREYLGLVIPRRRDIAIGLAGLVLIYAAFVVLNVVVGPLRSPASVVAMYRSAAAAGLIPALIFGAVVLAPVSEELLIRGFMLPGWAASWLGPKGAVLLTTVVWTVLHTQYDWIVLMQIACIGLLLGWLRQRSGSTLLTMVLHAVQNAAAMIQVAILDRLA